MTHRHAVYHGDRVELLGKTAIIKEPPEEWGARGNLRSLARQEPPPDILLAQFDDPKTGCGYGWWVFRSIDFTLYPVPYE